MPRTGETAVFWGEVLDEIRQQVSRNQFETWFAQTQCEELSDSRILVAVPNTFYSAWLTKQYMPVLQTAVTTVAAGQKLKIEFLIDENLRTEEQKQLETNITNPQAGDYTAPKIEKSSPPRMSDSSNLKKHLNPDYTLDNFIVGASNRMGHAAALAVIENPGKVYNPLFVHGGLGLGKTHLLQGISHEILARSPGIRMEYVPCEQFINEFISALEKNEINAFRQRYRDLDVLMIDDIHFLANKDHTQEEFFHTFNFLYNEQKQIILSSDSPPRDIPTLEERLVSRFKWGLVCEVEPPVFEMRMGIIRKCCTREGMDLSDDVVDLLAGTLKGSIRELEGAITRLAGYSRIMQEPVTVEVARRVLSDLLGAVKRRITMDDIIEVVTDHYNVRLSDLQSKKRFHSITLPRQICMHLARKHTPLSLTEIGGYFGGRDHSTVLYADDKITKRVNTDPELRDVVEDMSRQLKI